MRLRVKDEGGSKGRSVMGRIGVATGPHPKGGRLPSGVGGREPSANRRRLGCRYVRGGATAPVGAPTPPEGDSVPGPPARNLQSAPRPKGPPRAAKGVGR